MVLEKAQAKSRHERTNVSEVSLERIVARYLKETNLDRSHFGKLKIVLAFLLTNSLATTYSDERVAARAHVGPPLKLPKVQMRITFSLLRRRTRWKWC